MSEKRGGRRAARHAAAAAAAACPNANRSAATGSSAKPRHPTSQFAEGKAPGLGAATHGSGNWGEGLARTKRVVGGEQVAEGVAGHQRGTRGLIQRAGSRHRPEGVFAGLAEPRAPQGPGHPSTHHQEAISSAGSCRMGGWRAKRAGDAAVALVLRPQGRVSKVICDVTEAMPINGLGAHKPCPLALDCMKACNTARAAKGGLRERSGAKGGEGGEGRLMASPRAASIPVGGRGRSRTRTPPPPESGPTHPGTVAGRAARRAGGGRKGEGGTREDRARGGRGKRKSASICGLRGGE